MLIRESQDILKGQYLEIEAENQPVKIIFTWHSIEALEDYEITLEEALHFLLYPEEVVRGHGNRFVAHRRLNDHLTRIVYE